MATVDLNNALANTILDLFDTEFPAGSLLQIRTGAAPGAEAAASGTLLVEITLPATPWASAAGGSKAKQNTWSNTAVATGTAAHFRLKNAGGTRIIEGTVTATGGGGGIELDSTSINSGQTVTITSLTASA